MKTKKMRLAGIVMLAVTLIVVGVLVWPQPKEALATYTYFEALINWVDEDNIHLNGVTLTLITYYDSARLLEFDRYEMSNNWNQGTQNSFKTFFIPDPSELYWGVMMETEFQWEPGINPNQDDDQVVQGQTNSLDQWFDFQE